MGRQSKTNERFFLSAPSSHLRAPPQVPEHADRIEWIDDTRTRSAGVVVLKVERSRHTQLVLFVLLLALLGASLSRCTGIAALFVIGVRLARLERCRNCAHCPPESRTVSASAVVAATLAFLITSETDIEEDGGSGSGGGVVFIGLVAPTATSPASPHRGTRPSGDDGDS